MFKWLIDWPNIMLGELCVLGLGHCTYQRQFKVDSPRFLSTCKCLGNSTNIKINIKPTYVFELNLPYYILMFSCALENIQVTFCLSFRRVLTGHGLMYFLLKLSIIIEIE